MRRVEKLGIELAYALRERDSRRQLWESADAEVRRIERALLDTSPKVETGSQPAVSPDETVIIRPGETRLLECPGAPYCHLAGQMHTHTG